MLSVRYFLIFYIFVHLTVSVFGLRYWPFTDYPMFGDAHQRYNKIYQFRYVYYDNNGQTYETVGYGFGAGNPTLQTFAIKKDIKQIKHFANEYAKIFKNINFVKWELRAKVAIRTDDDHFNFIDELSYSEDFDDVPR